MKIVMSWLRTLRRVGQKAGPYLFVEMLLPGGTVLALLLFLYRDGKFARAGGIQRAIVGARRAWAAVFGQRAPVTIGSRS